MLLNNIPFLAALSCVIKGVDEYQELFVINPYKNILINKNLEIILPSIETIDYNEESTTIENTEKTEIKSLKKIRQRK